MDGDEVKTAQITVWTEQYEIFAEHTPPVAGQAARFITHVSEVRTGKPRSSGAIKFVFVQGERSLEHSQEAPDRPGIYIPAITFPNEGDWQADLIIPGETNATADLGVITVFSADDAAARAEYPDAPEGVTFLKEQQWRIEAKTERAARRTLVERVALHATVVPAPGAKATIHSPVTGRLLSKKLVRLGTEVKAGEIVGWVEPAFNEFTAKLVEAEAEALRAKVMLEQAKAAFERTRSLFEQQAKSQRELQEAELAYRTAEAAFEAAGRIQQLYRATGATFEEGGLRIALKAPFDGVIDKVANNVGQRIEPDEPLLTIVNTSSPLLQAQVLESRVTAIKPELGAVLQLSRGGASRIMANRLEFVSMGREVDPITRTLPVTYKIESAELPIPLGSAGMLLVATGRSFDALAIPTRAIVEEDGMPIAFVQVAGETFQKRNLETGVQDGEWTEVLSGVNEGERVVTDGAYPLLLSTKTGTIPAHGHAH